MEISIITILWIHNSFLINNSLKILYTIESDSGNMPEKKYMPCRIAKIWLAMSISAMILWRSKYTWSNCLFVVNRSEFVDKRVSCLKRWILNFAVIRPINIHHYFLKLDVAISTKRCFKCLCFLDTIKANLCVLSHLQHAPVRMPINSV